MYGYKLLQQIKIEKSNFLPKDLDLAFNKKFHGSNFYFGSKKD
jgi:hypothetical protein